MLQEGGGGGVEVEEMFKEPLVGEEAVKLGLKLVVVVVVVAVVVV